MCLEHQVYNRFTMFYYIRTSENNKKKRIFTLKKNPPFFLNSDLYINYMLPVLHNRIPIYKRKQWSNGTSSHSMNLGRKGKIPHRATICRPTVILGRNKKISHTGQCSWPLARQLYSTTITWLARQPALICAEETN